MASNIIPNEEESLTNRGNPTYQSRDLCLGVHGGHQSFKHSHDKGEGGAIPQDVAPIGVLPTPVTAPWSRDQIMHIGNSLGDPKGKALEASKGEWETNKKASKKAIKFERNRITFRPARVRVDPENFIDPDTGRPTESTHTCGSTRCFDPVWSTQLNSTRANRPVSS